MSPKPPSLKPPSVPKMKLPKEPKIAGAPSAIPDKFPSEVKMQNRRLTGVTPHLVGLYNQQPARLLPRSKEFNLRGLAGVK